MSLPRYEVDAKPGESTFAWIVRAAAERRAARKATNDYDQMLKEIRVAAEGKARAAREREEALDRQARRTPRSEEESGY